MVLVWGRYSVPMVSFRRRGRADGYFHPAFVAAEAEAEERVLVPQVVRLLIGRLAFLVDGAPAHAVAQAVLGEHEGHSRAGR